MASFVFMVTLLALLNNQLASADNMRYFIHPLFDHAARLYNPVEGKYWSTVYKNYHASVYQSTDAMMVYQANEWDETAYNYSADSNFETGLAKKDFDPQQTNILKYPVDDEHKRIRNYQGNDCLEQSFRAFELLSKDKINAKYYGVGMAQGPGLCVISYKSGTEFKNNHDLFRNIENVQYIDGPSTYFRVTAISSSDITNTPVNGALEWASTVDFLDEAGHHYVYKIKEDASSGNLSMVLLSITDLSAVNFEGLPLKSPNSYTKLKNYLKENVAFSTMASHFNHSFIEAISVYRDKLIYARAMDHAEYPRLHLASASSDATPFMFGTLIRQPTGVYTDKIVNAFEMYDHDGKVIAHIAVSRRLLEDGELKGLRAEPEYYFCTFANLDVFRTETGRGDLREIQEEDITCVSKKLYRNFMPIDIVHIPHCKKTVFFYDHWYSEIEDGKPFDASSVEKKYMNWMHRPVNAILYNDGRFYFFMHGSELLISKKHSQCSWENMELENVYYMSSQLIMKFKGHREAEMVPFYNNMRSFQSSPDDKFLAEPPLVTLKDVRISPELMIKPNEDSSNSTITPAPTTPTTTSNTTTPGPIETTTSNTTTPGPIETTTSTPPTSTTPPESKPRGSTLIIIIATIVIMILAAVLFLVYYFCCGDAEEPPVRRLKSNLLQGRKTARAEPEKRPVQVPPGSALTSASTVRSDINLTSSLANKSTVKAASNVGQPVAAAKSVGPSTLAATKTKSRSPGISPSVAKSKEALSSKRSSPKTSDLNAKTLSKSKRQTKLEGSPGSKNSSPVSSPKTPDLNAKTLSRSKRQTKLEGSPGSKNSSPVSSPKTPEPDARPRSRSKKMTKSKEALNSRNSSPKTPDLNAKTLSKSKKLGKI